jgi:multimeric flavodoxin WrbA
MMAMKVLLFNGSPHKNGCTYTALDEVARTLNAEGVETEIIQVGSVAFQGCMACGGCKDGKCVFGHRDGLNEIVEKCKAADGFVFGSPVYYASANGTMISFMDRLFYTAGRSFAHKPGAVVASARRAGTTVTLDELTKYLTISQMPVVSSTYWTMVHGSCAEDVKKDEEGLQTMRNLGKNMAWLLKCIEIGRSAGVEAPVAERDHRTNFIR